MYIKRFLVVIAGIMLLGAACSKSTEEEASGIDSQTKTEATRLKDVKGEEIQNVIASYKGDKAVLVNVWATWCVPCVEEFPEIVEIQRKYPDKLQVIFISADFPENRDKAVEFLEKHNVDWVTYFKTGKDEPFINAISREWSGALPFTKVIDIDGNVIAHWENKASFDTFDKHVKQAINP